MKDIKDVRRDCILTEDQIYEELCKRHKKERQDRLSKAKVAVCGLGGLGSNISISLARSGVGHLHLIDFDTVDISNLNRQQYMIRHLGMKKTQAMKEILCEINPYISIETDCIRLTEKNISSYIKNEDIVCEAFDSAAEKAMLVNTVLSETPHKYVVSGNGMAGYGRSDLITTKKRLDRLYICGDGTSGIESGEGLFAARVAICANHCANKVLELILDEEIKE